MKIIVYRKSGSPAEFLSEFHEVNVDVSGALTVKAKTFLIDDDELDAEDNPYKGYTIFAPGTWAEVDCY